MTISISTSTSASWVTEDDLSRAKAAAQKVLDDAGVNDVEAHRSYTAQWMVCADEDAMTGPAVAWIAAGKAADIALTSTWAGHGAEVFSNMVAW